ncbi:hypothetical protein VTK73DRAFT_6801 [Phialemonium thermophilum]|uniref:DSBA-like thioredoxin domain-containing protein n=1 Tax=Phialemonium thermophilum TaxID=223376 RepID=A0ABR3Y772_9PEZI
MAKFDVRVVSDVICPWCYLGKRRLERAIDVYKKVVPGGANDSFHVTWHPFYLDPTLPKVGVETSTHLANKFGPDRVRMIQARLKTLGETEGIHFDFGKNKVGNTRDAHRVVQLAKTKSGDLENKVVEELFRSYFEQGGDVTSHDMLIAAAERAGLSREETKKWLEDGSGGAEVDREVKQAYAEGIHGVPDFLINGRYRINGAQDVEAFVSEFVRAKEAAPNTAGTSGGNTC